MINESKHVSTPPKSEELLGGGDDLFRLLLDSTGEGVYGTDLDGNCMITLALALSTRGKKPRTDVI